MVILMHVMTITCCHVSDNVRWIVRDDSSKMKQARERYRGRCNRLCTCIRNRNKRILPREFGFETSGDAFLFPNYLSIRLGSLHACCSLLVLLCLFILYVSVSLFLFFPVGKNCIFFLALFSV